MASVITSRKDMEQSTRRAAARLECYRFAARVMAEYQLTKPEMAEVMAEAMGDERLTLYRQLTQSAAKLVEALRPWLGKRRGREAELMQRVQRQVRQLQRIEG